VSIGSETTSRDPGIILLVTIKTGTEKAPIKIRIATGIKFHATSSGELWVKKAGSGFLLALNLKVAYNNNPTTNNVITVII